MINTKYILGGLIILVLLGGAVYWQVSNTDSISPGDDNNKNGTSTTPLIIGVEGENGGQKVILLSEEEIARIPRPNLDRDIVFIGNITPEAKIVAVQKIEDLRSNIRENPTSFYDWLQLGTLYKIIGDNEGARLAWEYVSAISPQNSVSFANLGDLYHFYLKDFPKAEFNLKKAIENDPTLAISYKNLYDLYHLSYQKETNKDEEILKSGLSRNPGSIDLMIALGLHYFEEGKKVEAERYISLAISEAKRLENWELVSTLEQELARVK